MKTENEAIKMVRKFILADEYKNCLPGAENKSEREKYRQKKNYLLDGGGLTDDAVVKAMKLQGYEVYFKKVVEKLA